ncbi:MAG: DoxX family protein [Pseudomonadota bacterium]
MKDLINKLIALVDNQFVKALALLGARIALAAPFWFSARTKVEEGTLLTLNDVQVLIFENEFGMPYPEIAAPIAMYAEHLFPILLILGLGTRFAAAGLFVMTLVIQMVFPDAFWTVHLYWFALAGILIAHGGGLLSADKLVWK